MPRGIAPKLGAAIPVPEIDVFKLLEIEIIVRLLHEVTATPLSSPTLVLPSIACGAASVLTAVVRVDIAVQIDVVCRKLVQDREGLLLLEVGSELAVPHPVFLLPLAMRLEFL